MPFPTVSPVSTLAAARLRHIAGTTWSAKCYMNMRPLYQPQFSETGPPWPDQMCEDFAHYQKGKGRKRHILVDMLGLLLNVIVHPADVQDRDGAFLLLRRARRLFPFIKCIFADGGYAGEKTGARCLANRSMEAGDREAEPMSLASRSCPKGGLSKGTFAWISRNRRLARDFGADAMTVAAFVRLAMIRIMLRRLAANASS